MSVTTKAKLLRFVIFLYVLFYFFNYFLNIHVLSSLQAFLGLIMLVLAALNLGINHFKLPLFLFLTGSVLMVLFADGSFPGNLQTGLLQMSSIIGLLAVVPMISWALRSEPYIEEIIGLAHNFLNTSRKFYSGILVFTHIIAYFLLFGSIPMMYQFVNDILKSEHGSAWEAFKGTALLRGFALSTLWVISIPSFAYAVEALDPPLFTVIIQGLLLAAAGMAVAIGFSHAEEKNSTLNYTEAITIELNRMREQASAKKHQKRKALEFGFLFISLFGTIFLAYALLDVELMMLIPITIMIWSIIYFLVKWRPKELFAEAKDYYRYGLSGKGYQFSVMTSAGVLIFGLNQLGIGTAIVDAVYALQDFVPFINILYFLPLIVIALGFMGLGPLPVMVLVAGILEDISLPFPPELVVLAVTSGSAIAILISPLLMPVIILSEENGMSPLKNGLKHNYKYAIVLYIMVQIYIQLRVYL